MTAHLSAEDLALHLDGLAFGSERARIEAHLAGCDECRAELIAASQLLRTRPQRRRWYVPAGIAAAAAAVVLIWVRPWQDNGLPNYREPAVSTTVAPVGLAPRGATNGTPVLVWTRVPHAQRYRVTVFDSAGTALWEAPTPDTSLAIPKSVRLRPGLPYLWQVAAETGFDRWIGSQVVVFVINPPRP